MSPTCRALISITSASATLFDCKETTGLFISEAMHPYKVLRAAGFEVDLASEAGTYTPDWLSQQPGFPNGDDLATWNNADSEFRKKLDNMPKASDLDGSKYGLFYASAGHAALIDYPTATSLQKIAERVWVSSEVGIPRWSKKLLLVLAQPRAPGIWNDFHIVDGRLVTGQNPTSAESTARATVAVFETL
ncbi:Glyoxalase 3 [Fusarium acuminatum]|uniref:D-lactate dehydratase n=1 Tax=Fusarium acuminatum TaxID=5515 RepID=A0ABZ2XD75_9HYPO